MKTVVKIELQTTDNTKVAVAIGNENGKFYVQTTDLQGDTYLSEIIAEGLDSKEQALEIAKAFQDKYGFQLFDWTEYNSKPGTKIQNRIIEAMAQWGSDRLFRELESFILETPDEKLTELYFDDIATEEETKEGKLR